MCNREGFAADLELLYFLINERPHLIYPGKTVNCVWYMVLSTVKRIPEGTSTKKDPPPLSCAPVAAVRSSLLALAQWGLLHTCSVPSSPLAVLSVPMQMVKSVKVQCNYTPYSSFVLLFRARRHERSNILWLCDQNSCMFIQSPVTSDSVCGCTDRPPMFWETLHCAATGNLEEETPQKTDMKIHIWRNMFCISI